MKATKGKVTTTKQVCIMLGTGLAVVGLGTVRAWLAVFSEFTANGGGDKKAFAETFVANLKGQVARHENGKVMRDENGNTIPLDIWTANTVRQNLGRIAWAEETITGGALACRSMNHIVSQMGDENTTDKKAPSKPRKVTTVTLSEDEIGKRLRKAGFTAVEIRSIKAAILVA